MPRTHIERKLELALENWQRRRFEEARKTIAQLALTHCKPELEDLYRDWL